MGWRRSRITLVSIQSCDSRRLPLPEAERPVLVATVAFGMGVDRGDVGLVLHLDLPATPEGYSRNRTRRARWFAGAMHRVLFLAIAPAWAGRCRLTGRHSQPEHEEEVRRRVELAQQQLRRMEAVAEGEMCRQQALLLAVGELAPPCGRCDRCQGQLHREDWSEPALTLLQALEEDHGTDARSLSDSLAAVEPLRWGWLMRRMVQEELIQETNDGSQRLFLRDSGRRFPGSPGRCTTQPTAGDSFNSASATILDQVLFVAVLWLVPGLP